ncbi:hypothetical protein ACFVMC_01250 [Nocardia sp. NPDC127579]|uniref:hypothetical protein n=1 Tax=Nocardia sp. NPDC127579 TaxID=3345402 RepID=UPI0036340A54
METEQSALTLRRICKDVNGIYEIVGDVRKHARATDGTTTETYRRLRQGQRATGRMLGILLTNHHTIMANQHRHEHQLNALTGKVDALTGKVGSIDADVETLKTNVETLKTDVATLNTDVAELKTDVATLKEDVRVLKEDVRVLKEDMGGVKQRLEDIVALLQVRQAG